MAVSEAGYQLSQHPMAEFITEKTIRVLAVTFPIFVALICQHSKLPIPDDSGSPRRELTVSEETIVHISFALGLLTAIFGLPFLQNRLFYASTSSSKFLFSWDSATASLLPLIGSFVQGFAVAFLLQLALVRAYFRARFHTEILNASCRPKRSYHPRFEMPWAFDPRKVRIFIWLAACLSVALNGASVGTYLRIDKNSVRQNIFWAGEKQFPIDHIEALEIAPYATNNRGIEWELSLRLIDSKSVKLLEAFGRVPRWQVYEMSEALNQARGMRIPVYEVRK